MTQTRSVYQFPGTTTGHLAGNDLLDSWVITSPFKNYFKDMRYGDGQESHS